ncbi:hypothetical protein L0Y46_01340 [bacterium]|nr:hypothetical protein [bacterium]
MHPEILQRAHLNIYMKYSRAQIDERIKYLPKDVQQSIADVGIDAVILEIGKKHGLHIDKIGILAEIIALVLYGLEHPKNFITRIAAEVGVSRQKASEIADDVNQRIFLKLRQSLREMYGELELKKEGENGGPPALHTEPVSAGESVPESSAKDATEVFTPVPSPRSYSAESGRSIIQPAQGPFTEEGAGSSKPITFSPPDAVASKPEPRLKSSTEESKDQAATPEEQPGFMDEKFSRLFGSEGNKQPEPPSSPASPEEEKRSYTGGDPYREPVE